LENWRSVDDGTWKKTREEKSFLRPVNERRVGVRTSESPNTNGRTDPSKEEATIHMRNLSRGRSDLDLGFIEFRMD